MGTNFEPTRLTNSKAIETDGWYVNNFSMKHSFTFVLLKIHKPTPPNLDRS